jgi:hypothetical protein
MRSGWILNERTCRKKYFVFLVSILLLTTISTGCTKQSTTENSNTKEVVKLDNSNTQQTLEEKANDEISRTTEKKNIEAAQKSETIITDMKSPLPFNMQPHEPATDRVINIRNLKPSLVGAFYGEGYRFQIVKVEGKTVTIEFGNTSGKPITLTDENFYFLYIANGGANISGTKLEGSPVTVASNSKKTLKVSYSNSDTMLLMIKMPDLETPLEVDVNNTLFSVINDTTPFISKGTRIKASKGSDGKIIPDSMPSTGYTMEVTGNGKVKYQPVGIQFTDNDKVGTIVKPEGGMIVLAKIRLANTSDQELVINDILIGSYSTQLKKIVTQYEFTEEDMKEALGDRAFPMIVKPKTIVEGFVPFFFKDSNESCFFTFRTNMGWLEVNNPDTILPFDWQ